MQDIKSTQKVLKDSGILTSNEAIVLMRVLADEQISPKMLSTLPGAIAKIVPNVIQKLVDEHLKMLDQQKELEKKFEDTIQANDLEKEVYLQLISEDQADIEKLAKLPTQARNLVKTYLSTNDSLSKLKKKHADLLEDLQKLTNYVKSMAAKRPSLEKYQIADDLLPLANAVLNLTETISERLKNNLLATIETGIQEGSYQNLSADVVEMINRLVIRRLEEILKPYEELSRQYVAGELSHEEFTESLKRNALLNHMREQVVTDTIMAIEQGRLDAQEVPPKLRTAIQNLIHTRSEQSLPAVTLAGPSDGSTLI